MDNSISLIPIERNIFTNRTLNMRSIQAIGYDMDYTLIHYDVKLPNTAIFFCFILAYKSVLVADEMRCVSGIILGDD